MPNNPCPSVERLTALLTGAVPEAEQEPLARHVDECAACQHRLEDLAADVALPLPPADREVAARSPRLEQVMANLKAGTEPLAKPAADLLLAAGAKLRYFHLLGGQRFGEPVLQFVHHGLALGLVPRQARLGTQLFLPALGFHPIDLGKAPHHPLAFGGKGALHLHEAAPRVDVAVAFLRGVAAGRVTGEPVAHVQGVPSVSVRDGFRAELAG